MAVKTVLCNMRACPVQYCMTVPKICVRYESSKVDGHGNATLRRTWLPLWDINLWQ